MEINYFPTKEYITDLIQINDPLLAVISFDGEQMYIGSIDDCVEHHILLNKVGKSEADIDKYFRIIVNNEGADWTFVCPSGYKNIDNKEYRIRVFYKDGIEVITQALKLLGVGAEISIPSRYRRHIDIMTKDS